jgi:hypothetical protein
MLQISANIMLDKRCKGLAGRLHGDGWRVLKRRRNNRYKLQGGKSMNVLS